MSNHDANNVLQFYNRKASIPTRTITIMIFWDKGGCFAAPGRKRTTATSRDIKHGSLILSARRDLTEFYFLISWTSVLT